MRLVRHDQRALAEWRRGIAFFDHFVSYQKDDNRTPYGHYQVTAGESRATEYRSLEYQERV